MEGAQFLLEIALLGLLAATLFHALRLERALGVLKRDRAVLEELVAGFNESTRAAEAGIERLRGATDGAGRQIARQIEQAQRLRDDLGFLSDRGEKLAERLEGGVRAARMAADQHGMAMAGHAGQAAPGNPSAQAFSGQPQGYQNTPYAGGQAAAAHQAPSYPAAMPSGQEGEPAGASAYGAAEPAAGPRLRSEAERDLLRALRAAR